METSFEETELKNGKNTSKNLRRAYDWRRKHVAVSWSSGAKPGRVGSARGSEKKVESIAGQLHIRSGHGSGRKALRIDDVARPGALIAGDRTVPKKSGEATKLLKHSHFKRRVTARLRVSEGEFYTVEIVTRRGFQICGWFVNTINGVKTENEENDEQQWRYEEQSFKASYEKQ
ncbi:hypothetical protein PIB30_101087 [Stylosanthes scabra]|uniref:Uncharacterized protein n=1 Tax=Stylosanthes scabra TaxID=79078 RepID=A0ABU6TWS8_9FABA|nr:hypothetical protein [Stylosanthes scabra]